eukprot:3249586-Rhodomonas_salina.1
MHAELSTLLPHCRILVGNLHDSEYANICKYEWSFNPPESPKGKTDDEEEKKRNLKIRKKEDVTQEYGGSKTASVRSSVVSGQWGPMVDNVPLTATTKTDFIAGRGDRKPK